MHIIPSEKFLSSMELYSPNNTDTIKTMFSLNSREDVFDLDEFSCDPAVTSTDIRVYKLLYHPRGSNIFYSLSREYIYQQDQRNYFNNQPLFTSFVSLNVSISYVSGNRYHIFSGLFPYEDLLVVKAHIPRGSIFTMSQDRGLFCSNRLVIEKKDFYKYHPSITF